MKKCDNCIIGLDCPDNCVNADVELITEYSYCEGDFIKDFEVFNFCPVCGRAINRKDLKK